MKFNCVLANRRNVQKIKKNDIYTGNVQNIEKSK